MSSKNGNNLLCGKILWFYIYFISYLEAYRITVIRLSISFTGLYLWEHVLEGPLNPTDKVAQWREGELQSGKIDFR